MYNSEGLINEICNLYDSAEKIDTEELEELLAKVNRLRVAIKLELGSRK